MQVKLISKNKDKTSYLFMVKGTEPAVLNALRRSMISLVPTMAIEFVEFRKNSSVLYDEMLAHRLGLIPLKTDLKHYEVPTTPEDYESMKCALKLTLKAKGPCTVYASDIKSSDPAVVPVYGDMPIVKLAKGQELELEATAVLGQGKEHMKWSPGVVYYKNKPIVTIKGSVDTQALARLLPEDSAFKISGNSIKVDDEVLYTTSYVDAFINEEIVPGVAVTAAEDEFVFVIESFGQLSVKEIIATGVDKLIDRFEALEVKMKE